MGDVSAIILSARWASLIASSKRCSTTAFRSGSTRRILLMYSRTTFSDVIYEWNMKNRLGIVFSPPQGEWTPTNKMIRTNSYGSMIEWTSQMLEVNSNRLASAYPRNSHKKPNNNCSRHSSAPDRDARSAKLPTNTQSVAYTKIQIWLSFNWMFMRISTLTSEFRKAQSKLTLRLLMKKTNNGTSKMLKVLNENFDVWTKLRETLKAFMRNWEHWKF